MNNFWKKLKKPFFVLAPMADVTDMAFRQIVLSCGRPDVFYTEFVSADGLCSEKGKPKLMPHLKFKNNERPIVAQFFGSNPDHFYKSARLAEELGFDGIDINMGCPDRKVLKQGGGASLILKPELAKEIIKAVKEGAESASASGRTAMPVSVKTRIGYDKIITAKWISNLIEAEPEAIIIHGRTMKEMSKVPAHWDEIGKGAELCRQAGITVVGNGDIMTHAEGVEKAGRYGLDGIMVGRGIFANPWFFNPSVDPAGATKEKKISLMLEHIKLFSELWGEGKNFDTLKKFFKIYIHGWEGAKELRTELMKAGNKEDLLKIYLDLKDRL